MSQSDSRSKLAVGMDWATRVTTIGFEFALPPIAGAQLDRWWKITPALTILGALLGFSVGMVHILRIARDVSKS